jgi:hypothetical protein
MISGGRYDMKEYGLNEKQDPIARSERQGARSRSGLLSLGGRTAVPSGPPYSHPAVLVPHARYRATSQPPKGTPSRGRRSAQPANQCGTTGRPARGHPTSGGYPPFGCWLPRADCRAVAGPPQWVPSANVWDSGPLPGTRMVAGFPTHGTWSKADGARLSRPLLPSLATCVSGGRWLVPVSSCFAG